MLRHLPQGHTMRSGVSADHARIIAVLKTWWGGRDLTSSLPRFFLDHFGNTSFIIEKESSLTAFLIGFFSASRADEAYIHFAGVHPDFQGRGIGAFLYHHFFELCRQNRRHIVRACTSPVNSASVKFHRRVGFELEKGDAEIDGLPVTLDYNRPGDPKVRFKIRI